MAEKKSLLEQINAQEQLDHPISPFKQKEKTKPIRIKESLYAEIRDIAFKNNAKMVDIAEELLNRGLKNYNRSHTNYK